jgi:hypothetical protein
VVALVHERWAGAVVAVLALLWATPAAGQPPPAIVVQSASAQGVQATLTTKPNPLTGQEPVPVALTIVDDGQTEFSGPLGVPCHGCELSPPGRGPLAVQVRDLDSSGSPQVLVYLDDDGYDFYSTLAIYYRTATGIYRPLVLRSLYVDGAYVTNVGVRQIGTGPPVLVSDDDRYLPFLTGAGSEQYANLPLVVWSYADGKLIDVSSHYPGLLRQQAARALRNAATFERYRLSSTDPGTPDPRDALATYAADEARLGHRAAAERELRRALAEGWLSESDEPYGAEYIRALNRLLGTTDEKPALT